MRLERIRNFILFVAWAPAFLIASLGVLILLSLEIALEKRDQAKAKT